MRKPRIYRLIVSENQEERKSTSEEEQVIYYIEKYNDLAQLFLHPQDHDPISLSNAINSYISDYERLFVKREEDLFSSRENLLEDLFSVMSLLDERIANYDADWPTHLNSRLRINYPNKSKHS